MTAKVFFFVIAVLFVMQIEANPLYDRDFFRRLHMRKYNKYNVVQKGEHFSLSTKPTYVLNKGVRKVRGANNCYESYAIHSS